MERSIPIGESQLRRADPDFLLIEQESCAESAKLWDNFMDVSLFVSVSLSSSVALSVALDRFWVSVQGASFRSFWLPALLWIVGRLGVSRNGPATNRSIARIESKIVFLPSSAGSSTGGCTPLQEQPTRQLELSA